MKKQSKNTENNSGEISDEKAIEMEKDLNDLIEESKTRSKAYLKIIKEIEKRINKPD